MARTVTSTPGTSEGQVLPAHVDVLVVGAGLSGICLATHLTMKQPGRTFAIIDGRDSVGGTWDLFRYPGIRSDSELQTYTFELRPWTRKNAIANGSEILSYLRETVEEYGLAPHVHLGHVVAEADFSTASGQWTVTLRRVADGELVSITCDWLFSAAGYYDYAGGYAPAFEGQDSFTGQIVHPQAWPEDLDYAGKQVVVIGSGATAVTLVPALAKQSGHVTMLQRSPSYVISVPREDPIVSAFNRLLPSALAYRASRALIINRLRFLYWASRRYPNAMRRLIRRGMAGALPDGYDMDTHFNPAYNPFDQRLCVVPDGDFFKAISGGSASVVTGRIARMTPGGILLESGEELKADIVVTATGLNMIPFGGVGLAVDGEKVDLHSRLAYKGFMVSGVPNFAFAIGYTNNSWTLKVDLVADHLCRLLAHMDRQGRAIAVPVNDDPSIARGPFFDLGSGYVQRAAHLFPAQGSHGPWTMPQDYNVDRDRLRCGPVEDPALCLTAVREGVPA